MEEITKEWPAEFLIPVDQAELSDPDLIGSPVVTHEEYDAPKQQQKEEERRGTGNEQRIRRDCFRFTWRGGGDEVDKEEDKREEDK
jgi:hypothetical protein